MEILGDKITFDIWIDHAYYPVIEKNLDPLIKETIEQRERIHVLTLDKNNYTYEVFEYKLERRYNIKVSCTILKKNR